jgi:hypothetical protein
MRRSFLLDSSVLSWFLHLYLYITHTQIDRLWSPLSKVTKHWFLFILVRTLGRLLEPWYVLFLSCEASPNCSMVVALQCCFPIVCFCHVS